MKKIYLLIVTVFTCLAGNANAQAPDWLWAKGMGSTLLDEGHDIVTDASGNVYTTGYFYGTVDFDPGPDIFNLTPTGMADVFVSKSDNSGNLIWAKAMGGVVDDHGNSIVLDASGNVYTTGYFQGIADFDPGVNTFNLFPVGYRDIFISKLDNAGNFVWAKGIGGTGVDVSNAVAIDALGSIYTTGIFQDTVDFDPDVTSVFNLSASLFGFSTFVSKFNSEGNFVWAKALGGSTYAEALSIAIDNANNVYTTGLFEGIADFDPDLSENFNLVSTGVEDMFISKLNSSGSFSWAKRIGGTEYVNGFSIALDATGNVYTTGFFEGTVDFNPDSLVTYNLTPAGYRDIFISKSDNSGNFEWTKAIGGPFTDYSYSIALDASANVYITGFYQGEVDFDPDVSATFNLPQTGGDDVFVSKLNSSGNFVWAKAMGGTGNEDGLSIALDASGNAYISGWFDSPSIVVGSDSLTFAGSRDLFIAGLSNYTNIIEQNANETAISIYPNPATNHCTIALPGLLKTVAINITDINGKIIYATTSSSTQNLVVNTQRFIAGVYIVQIQAQDFMKTRKLIIIK